MPALLLCFITAFSLTYFTIPAIIRVARERKLYDQPNERSAHQEPTPSLGGIGIFGGTLCAIILWTPYHTFGVLQYILAAFMIIFLIGVRDDLLPIAPATKVFAQVLAAVILVYKSGVRIENLYGILGIYALPELSGFALSILAIVGIINAFNLIDGINGLAGSIGLLACLLWGSWFYLTGYPELAGIAFSLAGALLAFLKYNFYTARVFMGDTGALFIGVVCSILAIKFIEVHQTLPATSAYSVRSAPALATSVLILPLFDTIRVFVLRIVRGLSPFAPDKQHIHHMLLEAGYSHQQATGILAASTLMIVVVVALLDCLGSSWLLLLQVAMAMFGVGVLQYFLRRIRKGLDNAQPGRLEG